MAGATRSIIINAPVEKCYSIISDYERYPEFLPEVKRTRTANRRGNEVDVHYEAEVVKIIKYTVHIKEDRPAGLTWTLLEGEFMKENRGGWVLEAEGEGRTRATYNIAVEVGLLVPKTIINVLVDTQLPKLLENFKKRIETMP
jgi:ribosome-associated toxin RatA of RatAB toxin-antitoxin module